MALSFLLHGEQMEPDPTVPPGGQIGNTAPGALLRATEGTPVDWTIKNDQFHI